MPTNDIVFDKGGAVYNVLASGYGVTGNGTTDDRTALNTLANTTIPAAGGVLYFPPGSYRLASAITFPRAVTLVFAAGATLKPDSGVAVTIRGVVSAEPTQIFTTGAGTIVFGGNGIWDAYLQWWGAVNDNATDCTAAWNAAVAALPAAGGRLTIPPGTYKFAGTAGVSVTRSGVYIEGTPGTVLSFPAATAACVTYDGSSLTNGIDRSALSGCTIDGNANATIGLLMRKCARDWTFSDVKVRNVTIAAFQLEQCTVVRLVNPKCSVNDGSFTTTPQYGIVLDGTTTDGHTNTTGCTIENPMIEGLPNAVGMWFKYADNNLVLGGSCEAVGTGVLFDANASGNTVEGMFAEGNSTANFAIAGHYNTLRGVHGTNNVTELRSGSHANMIVGGFHDSIGILSGTLSASLDGCVYYTSFTNSSTGLIQKRAVWNVLTARYDPDQVVRDVVTPGSGAGFAQANDAADLRRKIFWGLDTDATYYSQGVGYVQAERTGVANLPLLLNPTSGPVLVNKLPSAATPNSGEALQVIGDISASGDLAASILKPKQIITRSGSTAISITPQAGAGTSPPTCTVVGTDVCGVVTLTTGTAPAASSGVFILTFGTAFPSGAPRVFLFPANVNAGALSGAGALYHNNSTGSQVGIAVGTTPLVASLQYIWNYLVIG